ncbi:MAG: hypothetical protein AAF531_19935 [Actinomycetota bacterium]
MTDFEPEEDLPPVAHVIMVYNGPVAPHWTMNVRYGDQKMLDDFWTRVNARLLLLPKHDPQFRRNRERVNRDAERERIVCDWDLGEDDAESTVTPTAQPASEQAAEAVPEAAPEAAEPAEADAADAAESGTADAGAAAAAEESAGGDATGDVTETEATAGQA